MSRPKASSISPEELVSYLRHSTHPAILVEGSDDRRVYRYLEEKLLDLDADVVVCSGRSTLLAVYEQRDKFKDLPVVFVADRDMWFFTGIPDPFVERIVFTAGYSIENDLYIRELFEGLMSTEERSQYRSLIAKLCQWQAHQLVTYQTAGNVVCDVHLNEICDAHGLRQEHLNLIGYADPPPDLVSSILGDYELALRGKTLFQALLRFLSNSRRASKYSRENLFELGAKAGNPRIDGLLQRTREAFSYESASIAAR